MIFYKCNCGLITNEIFKRCPSCGVESKKIKEEYEKVYVSTGLFKTESESLSGIFGSERKSLSGLFPDGKRTNY